MKPLITRKGFALGLGASGGVGVPVACAMAYLSIWAVDSRWLTSAAVTLVLSAFLYFVGYRLYPNEPDQM